MKIITPYNNRGITVTTTNRSGSTYLIYLLGLILPHDKFKFFREERWKHLDVMSEVENYYLNNFENNKTNNFETFQNYLMKSFINHTPQYEFNPMPGTYNIFLLRTNIFESVLSNAYSNITNIYRFKKNIKYEKITVSIPQFEKILKRRLKHIDMLLLNDSKIQYDLILEYEDFVQSESMDLNFERIGFKKIRNLPNNDIKAPDIEKRISNISELKSFYKGIEKTLSLTRGKIKNGYISDYSIQFQ